MRKIRKIFFYHIGIQKHRKAHSNALCVHLYTLCVYVAQNRHYGYENILAGEDST